MTCGQFWGILYRIILFYITHKDLGIDLMNIFRLILVLGIMVSYRHMVSSLSQGFHFSSKMEFPDFSLTFPDF